MGTNYNIYSHYFLFPIRFMAKIKQQQPDQDVARLGIEVARLLKAANLTTAWVRSESHFGDAKFSAFKKGLLTTSVSRSLRTSLELCIVAIPPPSTAGIAPSCMNC